MLGREEKKKPVYVINGFLDSGKTDFYRYTMMQPYFQTKGLTLLIVCEEGENDYDETLLKKTNTVKAVFEDPEAFTPSALMALESEHDPERVLIEWNGMWPFRDFKLPKAWRLEQQITVIDTQTFAMYFTNMKSLLSDQLRNSDLILFNRADGMEELPNFKRNVKAVNQKAEIIFEGKDGEIDVTLDEDLPYDLQADPIGLNNFGFGNFYLDALEHVDRYLGKRVRFKGMVMKPGGIPKGCFVPGRFVMTCCAQDIQVLGFACEYSGTAGLADKEWVEVTARVEKRFVEAYEGEGPFLVAESVEKTEPPKTEIIDFSNPDE
ncbi:MAG: GTPase [Lachnospiraceae bacterium]|nr:GTPase [Lachnospiraceae bacterium]